MSAQTVSEKILSRRAGRTVMAGDIAVCNIDCILGTDASTPMAIDYFERMGASRLAHPERVLFALDHYAPPSSPQTKAFHEAVKEFGRRHGAEVLDMGGGISHQVAIETGRAFPGCLIVGADSHTVMCGAVNAFATGIGSSDLAAAMATGQVWLRVPESIKVNLNGSPDPGVSGKDVALALLGLIGGDGAAYRTLEFHGMGIAELSMDDRLIVSNMTVEAGAKAGIFPVDATTRAFIASTTSRPYEPVHADSAATYAKELDLDLSTLQPSVALPHRPDSVTTLSAVVGTPIHMVFLGTCAGGRISDFHQALDILENEGGVASHVRLVVTPASAHIQQQLQNDGTLQKFSDMGAIITPPGCGPCCGTSDPIPDDGMNVMSTANRNFKARMGNPNVSIFLGSSASCAAAAAHGKIVDPQGA